MPKTIGIIGSRRRDTENDYYIVESAFFKSYKLGDKICSGGCPKGGDRFAEIIAKKFDIPILLYKADWKKFGKSAGFIRNSDIAQSSEILVACVAPDRKGGTEDTIKKFLNIQPVTNLILV